MWVPIECCVYVCARKERIFNETSKRERVGVGAITTGLLPGTQTNGYVSFKA